MKNSISVILLFSLLLTTMDADRIHAVLNPEKWALVWADEFDYSGEPDPDVWGYDLGYLTYNEELQKYTQSRRNSRVENGSLMIEAHLEATTDKEFQEIAKTLRSFNAKPELLQQQSATSARLVTRGKREFVHARVEVRARFSTGLGTWPAIWLLGDETKNPWPVCGEMDIMEHVGFQPNMVHSAVHTKVSNFMNQKGAKKTLPVKDVAGDFHVYSVEWDGAQIRFFIDDTCYHILEKGERTEDDWPFTEDDAYYLILNIAIGGSWGGREGVDLTAFPQHMEVDYVRVFEAIH
ncbi:MAG: glycoside hydrolase family 16 protein [Verrucomicrobiota bacterium]|nr:glycoside hydrolase family 16 protein [Verrucomicrobiota bacterium]